MPDAIRIFLVGASGRMGEEIRKEVCRLKASAEADVSIVGGLVAADEPACHCKVEGVDSALCSEWSSGFDAANVVVDFSSPPGARKALEIAREHKIPLMLGTTGLTAEDEAAVVDAATEIPIVRARNTSVGVNVMLKLVADAARMLGSSFDVEISEIHHKLKKDAPSGTAVSLVEALAAAQQVDPAKVMNCGRAGDDALRAAGEIGVQAIRGGTVPGDHTVYYFGENERIEITHRAASRAVFAQGAVRAACWLAPKKGSAPALYSMADVLTS